MRTLYLCKRVINDMGVTFDSTDKTSKFIFKYDVANSDLTNSIQRAIDNLH